MLEKIIEKLKQNAAYSTREENEDIDKILEMYSKYDAYESGIEDGAIIFARQLLEELKISYK